MAERKPWSENDKRWADIHKEAAQIQEDERVGLIDKPTALARWKAWRERCQAQHAVENIRIDGMLS